MTDESNLKTLIKVPLVLPGISFAFCVLAYACGLFSRATLYEWTAANWALPLLLGATFGMVYSLVFVLPFQLLMAVTGYILKLNQKRIGYLASVPAGIGFLFFV